LELTTVAIKQGKIVANGLFSNFWEELDLNSIPTTIFTPLEYSCVGLSEQ